jgi:hypothetical protein
MIPASCKESVPFTDKSSGIAYTFKPKSGAREREVMQMALGDNEKLSAIESANKLDAVINDIVLGWQDPNNKMPKFGSVKPADVFNMEEKWLLIKWWGEANALTAEEKKS